MSDQINLDSYIAGLIDGDGTVYTSIVPTNKTYQIRPRVSIYQSYVGGLFDAEGSVICGIDSRRFTFKPKSTMALREKEAHIFYLLQEYLLRKGIKSTIRKVVRENENWDDLLHFDIYGYYNVKRFLELIGPYTFIKKKQIDIMLNEILPKIRPKYIRNKRKYSKRQIIDIMKIVDKMNALKGHRLNNNKKYNEHYFRKLWGITD